MGSATTGGALFLTGLVVSAHPFRLDRVVILSVLGKNIIQPAFCLLFATAIRMDPYQRDYVVLLSAIPCGFFGVVFGKDFPNAVSHYEIATLFRMPSSNSVDQTIRRTKTYDGQTLKVLKHQISHK
jgi:predicted permease